MGSSESCLPQDIKMITDRKKTYRRAGLFIISCIGYVVIEIKYRNINAILFRANKKSPDASGDYNQKTCRFL